VPLSAGSRLGAYEILAAIGAGGMGEVYRARDIKLGRTVAVKVLPESFAFDGDRLARFEREARLLASRNHPHIAVLFGREEADGRHLLVMELVEGETLADRLRRGAPPVEETLRIARQVAEALEAAHERGVVHRDLKPANVMITPDDQIKVLDFGLAKALGGEPLASEAGGLTNSPTLSHLATQHGVILGTAAYMSPEQAKGLPADHRSDVFSFGAVLYEMLTGRQAFRGETSTDVLASVLARDPDLTALPPSIHPRLRELLGRCLEKNPKRRWQAIGDVRADIEAIAVAPAIPAVAPTAAAPRSLGNPALLLGGVVVLTAAVTSVVWSFLRPPATVPVVSRFQIPLGEDQTVAGGFLQAMLAISPDGTQIAYATGQLNVRSISEIDPRPIPGTVGAYSPVFSPDGRSIAFQSPDGTQKRVALSGGSPVTIGRVARGTSLSWDGEWILIAQLDGAIVRVPANGGPPESLVAAANNERMYAPRMLPDGQNLLFTSYTVTSLDEPRVVAQSLTSGARTTLIEGGSDAHYLPTGHLVYALGGTLFAVPFDAVRLRVTGPPTPVLEGVRRTPGLSTRAAHFSVADSGTLVYVPGPATPGTGQLQLVWIDREGRAEALNVPRGSYSSPRVSPDGRRLAYAVDDVRGADVWIYDLDGRSAARRLTVGGKNRFPTWSGDGRHVVFQSDRESDFGIFRQRADGSENAERLTRPEKGTSHVPESWPPRSDTFSYSAVADAGATLWTYSLRDKSATRFGTLESASLFNSAFSPDGHWIAYTLRTAGAAVYVQPFPPTGAAYQISRDADIAHHPLWSPDGKELFYFPGGNALTAVAVTTAPSLTFGNPRAVPGGFVPNTSPLEPRNHDITPDGGRFVATLGGPEAAGTPELRVVLNWFEDLKQRVTR
jgi:serine/threonine-protein kinase